MNQQNHQSSGLDEFSLIDTYFKQQTALRSDVILGIGDDAALMSAPANQLLVMAIDTLVQGVHFPESSGALDIGYKSLAVNLSDLAAMGAEPAWLMLALTMPDNNTAWLQSFASGLFDLAKQFNLQLIGGDTTHGPLTISIQVTGFVPERQALRRQGANVGDKIYVSGTLGDAGLGLKVATKTVSLPDSVSQFVIDRLERPVPRVALGMLLRGIATSAIDISDGLLADLDHITTASQKGARIITKALPLSNALKQSLSQDEAIKLALTAGDDYELCFTVPPAKEKQLEVIQTKLALPLTCIGEITEHPGIVLTDYAGSLAVKGYLHF